LIRDLIPYLDVDGVSRLNDGSKRDLGHLFIVTGVIFMAGFWLRSQSALLVIMIVNRNKSGFLVLAMNTAMQW